MDTEHEPGKLNSSGCSGCGLRACPTEDGRDGSPLSGWRLVLASMGLFLGPAVLAIGGAVCYSDRQDTQFLGAIAGLVIGMTGSVVLAKLVRRAPKAELPGKGPGKIAGPR